MLSGLEPCSVTDETGFQWVGERCNLMGSAKFKKLVDAYKWDEAMEVCIAQCEKKADILDFNFDSDLIDGQTAMSKFMKLCVTEPTVAKLPFMIDSSKWHVVEEGLKCVQGQMHRQLPSRSSQVRRSSSSMPTCACVTVRPSLSWRSTRRARLQLMKTRSGSASAATGSSGRSWISLQRDIIFDCNVLTIATGLPEHNSYALDFINAVAEIKRTCPCVSFSGGLSNLSFSFRGLNSLRDAMHTVFLHHAVPKGVLAMHLVILIHFDSC